MLGSFDNSPTNLASNFCWIGLSIPRNSGFFQPRKDLNAVTGQFPGKKPKIVIADKRAGPAYAILNKNKEE